MGVGGQRHIPSTLPYLGQGCINPELLNFSRWLFSSFLIYLLTYLLTYVPTYLLTYLLKSGLYKSRTTEFFTIAPFFLPYLNTYLLTYVSK